MQKFSLGAIALCSCALALANCNAAGAQNSVTLRKGQLEQVKPYTAPLQVYIVDERPRVKDLRQPETAPEQYVIPIGPVGAAAPNSVGGSSVRMERNYLPQASSIHSNVPVRPVTSGLAPVRMGGLSQVEKVRPVGSHGQQSTIGHNGTGKLMPPSAAPVASYTNTYERGGALTGTGGGGKGVSTNVIGAVRELRKGK